MKTAEEKVDDLMSNWITDAQTLAQLERRMVQLLIEQDRDTRYACAEAIMGIRVLNEGEEHIKDTAYAACTNVKAV